MAKTFFPDSTQLDTLNGHLNDISETLGGQNVLTRENLINLLGYEPVKPEGSYELIESITVSDDTTTVIERTAEPDGTAYNFKKIITKFAIPAVGEAKSNYISTRVNNHLSIWSNNVLSASDTMYCWHRMSVENGIYEQEARDGTKWDGSIGTLSGPSYHSIYFAANSSITKIEIFLSGSMALPSGTKIDIYAVRS